MGFYLEGINPQSDKGEGFSATSWEWRPICYLIVLTGVLDDRDLLEIGDNNGYEIPQDKAAAIVTALEAMLAVLPDKIAIDPDGPFQHSARKEDVQRFISFCRESGGFGVC